MAFSFPGGAYNNVTLSEATWQVALQVPTVAGAAPSREPLVLTLSSWLGDSRCLFYPSLPPQGVEAASWRPSALIQPRLSKEEP